MTDDEKAQYQSLRFDYFRTEGYTLEESEQKAARDLKKLLESIEDSCGR